MRNRLGKIFFSFLGTQALVFLLSFVYQQSITLLSYINITFYIASSLLFTSLIVFTVNSGFFDSFSHSFRTVFAGKGEGDKEKAIEEITPLSELVSFNANPILAVGLLDFILMLAALYVYYL